MLADEVTHVKMGSDWLRRLTADDKDRQKRALEFQRVVDKLFSLGRFRGEEDDTPVRLARRFRELAGFKDEEMDTLAQKSKEARAEMEARSEANRAATRGGQPRSPPKSGPRRSDGPCSPGRGADPWSSCRSS